MCTNILIVWLQNHKFQFSLILMTLHFSLLAVIVDVAISSALIALCTVSPIFIDSMQTIVTHTHSIFAAIENLMPRNVLTYVRIDIVDYAWLSKKTYIPVRMNMNIHDRTIHLFIWVVQKRDTFPRTYLSSASVFRSITTTLLKLFFLFHCSFIMKVVYAINSTHVPGILLIKVISLSWEYCKFS